MSQDEINALKLDGGLIKKDVGMILEQIKKYDLRFERYDKIYYWLIAVFVVFEVIIKFIPIKP